jgi:hypothetical protein
MIAASRGGTPPEQDSNEVPVDNDTQNWGRCVFAPIGMAASLILATFLLFVAYPISNHLERAPRRSTD